MLFFLWLITNFDTSNAVFVETLVPLPVECTTENYTLSCRREESFEDVTNSTSDLYHFIHFNRFITIENLSHIRVLQLNGLEISNLSNYFFEKFPNLVEVDLRNNNLNTLMDPLTLPSNFSKILLQGNKWNCSKNLKWALKLKRKTHMNDIEQLSCRTDTHIGKPLVEIAKFLEDIENSCTENCDCTLPKVVRDPEKGILEPIVEVNCSERGFKELPTTFPAKTKILHLQGNDIESLRPLKENEVFKKILDLYVDNNRISGIEELEGSYWLTHFRVFSLRGNKLSELPTYALDNALQQNINMPNAVRISLGGNPWRCDCVFTPIFQEMLQKYSSQIKDLSDVKCSYVEGDENSLLPIIEVSRSSVCRLPTEYSVQEALDLLNAVLASLIVFVLGKLAYDYYHFKKTGRLPWIVTKLP